MKARIITVEPRKKAAQEAQQILREKGYNAEVFRGYNYDGSLNDSYVQQLSRYDKENFFRGKTIFNDFISLCCALSHSLAISEANKDIESYSLVLEDDVKAEQVPSADYIKEMIQLIKPKDIDIVLFGAYWKRPSDAYLQAIVGPGNGAGCYLVKKGIWQTIFSMPIMGHIDQHFLQLHKKGLINVYTAGIKVHHATLETTRNPEVWKQ